MSERFKRVAPNENNRISITSSNDFNRYHPRRSIGVSLKSISPLGREKNGVVYPYDYRLDLAEKNCAPWAPAGRLCYYQARLIRLGGRQSHSEAQNADFPNAVPAWRVPGRKATPPSAIASLGNLRRKLRKDRAGNGRAIGSLGRQNGNRNQCFVRG